MQVTSCRASIRSIIGRVVGRDSGLGTRTVLYQLNIRDDKGGHISTRSKLSTVHVLVGRVKCGPSECGLTSNYNLSGCGCVSPRLLISFLQCTCSHASIFRGLCGTLPVNNISNALRFHVGGNALSREGMRTGANSFATVGYLTNCLGTHGKRRVTFTVVGRGTLSNERTHTFRSTIYSRIVH